MTLPYAILELFLHNLKESITNFKKTAAFSVARKGPGRFLSFPCFFPYFPPLSLWLSDSSVCLFTPEPHKLLSHQHTVPHCSLSPCWRKLHAGKTATPGIQPSAFLPVCLEHYSASPAPEGAHPGLFSRAMLTVPSWSLQPSQTFSSQALARL